MAQLCWSLTPISTSAFLSNQSSGEYVMQSKIRSGEATEDGFTGLIETGTARVPSTIFLAAALGSMAASLILKVSGKDDWALFVGQWAAPFLIMGNYNKMVKQHGTDALSSAA
jgi:hypothetical protein